MCSQHNKDQNSTGLAWRSIYCQFKYIGGILGVILAGSTSIAELYIKTYKNFVSHSTPSIGWKTSQNE